MIKLMLKEEWRKNRERYDGSYFALLPLLIFIFTFSFVYSVENFSTLSENVLANSLAVFTAFIGLSIGISTFPDKDVARNTLSKDNFLVYSSRTLPVSSRKLMTLFSIKEIVYYGATVLIPVALGFYLGSQSLTLYQLWMPSLIFFIALLGSAVIVQLSKKVGSHYVLKYNDIKLPPLAGKSLIDVKRSSGGFTKIVLSLGVVAGFYYFLTQYFPVASSFLNNPLLSFASIIGIVNLTVYNWLNLFDSLEDYLYLPYNFESVVRAKQIAFLSITVPFTILVITVLHFLNPGVYILSLFAAISMTIIALASVSRIGGLNPNEALMETTGLFKLILYNMPFVLPILFLSIVYPIGALYIWMMSGLALILGLAISFYSFEYLD